MTEEKIPTSEKLAQAMIMSGVCPLWIIENARADMYDDYKSDANFPLTNLIQDLKTIEGTEELVKRVINGDFDAQKWESDEWATSPEGKRTLGMLPLELRRQLFEV